MLRNERGANMIETALVSILLLVMLAGAVDFGVAFNNYLIITNAAREGTRRGVRLPCTATNASVFAQAIINATIQEAADGGLTLTASDITLTPDPTTSCPAASSQLQVTVTYQYPTVLGGVLGSPQIPISNSAIMMFFGNDQGS